MQETLVQNEEATVEQPTAEATETQAEQTPAELLATLQERLKNGSFPVELSNKTLKHLRSFLQTKATFKGQQEAIYLASALFVVEALVARDGEVRTAEKEVPKTYGFPAQAIQILNFFLGRHEGTGYHAAESFLAMAVPVTEANAAVVKTIETIESLKAEIAKAEAPTEAEATA